MRAVRLSKSGRPLRRFEIRAVEFISISNRREKREASTTTFACISLTEEA